MKVKMLLFFNLLLITLTSNHGFAQNDSAKIFLKGEALFQTNCSACHSIHKEIVGPMLASITKKRTEAWLINFIQNSQAVVASNDEYAVQLFEQYHHQVMPSFRQLKINEIKDILYYIEKASKQYGDDILAGKEVIEQSNPSVFHGQLIFQLQCAACHFINHEGGYGPALGSVSKRHSKQWLHSFINNSQEVIKSGDPYAKQLFERFDQRVMVSMEFLKSNEIEDVLQYIEYRSSSDHATAGAAGRNSQFGKKTSEIHSAAVEKPLTDGKALGAVVICLILAGLTIYTLSIYRLFKYLQNNS